MFPVLVKIGPVTLYTFGLMVMIAFLGGAWFVTRELKRRKIQPDHLEGYPLIALLGGIVGARVYYLLEHGDQLAADFFGTLFGGAGLTWYGGLIGGALAVLFWAKRNKQSLWALCDAFGPGLAAAYGLGRVGCQLSGDGDYGPPSDVPWAMAYPKGVVPTTVPVHPTPVYEILMMIPIVWILWRLRTVPGRAGWHFGLYLALVGTERFIAEFYRVRLENTLGLSMAQWISVAVVLAGLVLVSSRRPATPADA